MEERVEKLIGLYLMVLLPEVTLVLTVFITVLMVSRMVEVRNTAPPVKWF